ncbi:MAG: amino acid permease, partial [Actinocatenispora sp.]
MTFSARSPQSADRSAPGVDGARLLSRWQAVPLAIGSIAGSGILFLPSAVYVQSGANSILVWVLATVMCVPMLLMFQDMVRDNPGGDGIEAFIRAGLGDTLGRCVPVMFLSLVIVGLPAGALVAGRYATQALGGGAGVQTLAALAVLVAALATNLAGVRASTRLQHAAVWALVAMAVVLIGSAMPGAGDHLPALHPHLTHLGLLLPGVGLAFWAFAGFENLTFLSGQFRNPRRDLLPVGVIALVVYGVLTVLLTVAIAVSIPRGQVDSVTGLLQLAGRTRMRGLLVGAVAVIAFGAMVLNAVAWVWGVSRLVAAAGRTAILPRPLASTTGDGVPRRALGLLGVLFLVTGGVLVAFPALLVDALAATSGIFILLYALSIVSYARVRGLTLRTALNAPPLVLLVATLVESGWRSVYGLVALAVAVASQLVVRRRRRA